LAFFIELTAQRADAGGRLGVGACALRGNGAERVFPTPTPSAKALQIGEQILHVLIVGAFERRAASALIFGVRRLSTSSLAADLSRLSGNCAITKTDSGNMIARSSVDSASTKPQPSSRRGGRCASAKGHQLGSLLFSAPAAFLDVARIAPLLIGLGWTQSRIIAARCACS
jgi:hypothetical protein